MSPPVDIGRGKMRMVVRSAAVKKRLANIPEVVIDGNRVIYPKWMSGSIERVVQRAKRKRGQRVEQTEIFE